MFEIGDRVQILEGAYSGVFGDVAKIYSGVNNYYLVSLGIDNVIGFDQSELTSE